MIRFYAVVGSNFFEGDETDKGPDEGWIEMEGERPQGDNSMDYTAQADGTWAITQETLIAKLSAVENSWREEQMPIAQQTVTAIDFGEEGILGSIEDWKLYWRALRKWTVDNPDFPDMSKRPVQPV